MENIKIIETLSDGTQKELCISDVISRFIIETAKKYKIEKVDDVTIRLVGSNIFVVDACEVQMYNYKQSIMYREINDL
jgi:hypothetical protein